MRRGDLLTALGLLLICLTFGATIVVGDRLYPLGVSVGISTVMFTAWMIAVAISTGMSIALFFFVVLQKETKITQDVPSQSIEESVRQVKENPVPVPPKPVTPRYEPTRNREYEKPREVVRVVQPMPTIDELRDIKIVDEPEPEEKKDDNAEENSYEEAY